MSYLPISAINREAFDSRWPAISIPGRILYVTLATCRSLKALRGFGRSRGMVSILRVSQTTLANREFIKA